MLTFLNFLEVFMEDLLLNITNMEDFKSDFKDYGVVMTQNKWYPFSLESQPQTFIEYYKEKLGVDEQAAKKFIEKWNDQKWNEVSFVETFTFNNSNYGIFPEPETEKLIIMADYGIILPPSKLLSVPHYSCFYLEKVKLHQIMNISYDEIIDLQFRLNKKINSFEPVILEIG